MQGSSLRPKADVAIGQVDSFAYLPMLSESLIRKGEGHSTYLGLSRPRRPVGVR